MNEKAIIDLTYGMRTIVIITIVSIFMLSLTTTVANAETFDIGKEENKFNQPPSIIYYDSDTWLMQREETKSIAPLIIDGNKSTGINAPNSNYYSPMWIRLIWINGLYVSSIQVLNSFQEGISRYSLSIFLHPDIRIDLAEEEASAITFPVNELIYGLELNIFENPIYSGSGNFYFNDLIIKYTPEMDLESEIMKLQDQISSLSQHINALNSMLNEMDNTQQSILEDITSLSKSNDQLNGSFNELITEFEALNISYNQLNERLNELKKELETINISIKENITMIKDTIPEEYNYTALLDRISQLETENSQQQAEIDALKTKKQEKIIEKDPDNTLVYGAIGIGIIGIIIAIMALSKRPAPPISNRNDEIVAKRKI